LPLRRPAVTSSFALDPSGKGPDVGSDTASFFLRPGALGKRSSQMPGHGIRPGQGRPRRGPGVRRKTSSHEVGACPSGKRVQGLSPAGLMQQGRSRQSMALAVGQVVDAVRALRAEVPEVVRRLRAGASRGPAWRGSRRAIDPSVKSMLCDRYALVQVVLRQVLVHHLAYLQCCIMPISSGTIIDPSSFTFSSCVFILPF